MDPQDIVIFLGPTLAGADAAEILPARYLPPVQQGSIVSAVLDSRPRAIAIIDGLFGGTPAVRHKEILWALSKGIVVTGAASMGALRAAELSAYGMQGHGLIYRWYSRTMLADDDEVAVTMTPVELGARPISEALINIRLSVKKAFRCGVISKELGWNLIVRARHMHFSDRSLSNLLAATREELDSGLVAEFQRLALWLPENFVDQKREDALGLLRGLAEGWLPRPARENFAHFQVTETWAFDLQQSGLWESLVAN